MHRLRRAPHRRLVLSIDHHLSFQGSVHREGFPFADSKKKKVTTNQLLSGRPEGEALEDASRSAGIERTVWPPANRMTVARAAADGGQDSSDNRTRPSCHNTPPTCCGESRLQLVSSESLHFAIRVGSQTRLLICDGLVPATASSLYRGTAKQ